MVKHLPLSQPRFAMEEKSLVVLKKTNKCSPGKRLNSNNYMKKKPKIGILTAEDRKSHGKIHTSK